MSLAFYVVFWFELDNPHGTGTSAAIVYQPSLGASLRKALFRMVGTVVGAATIVVLTACFPQNRIFSWVLLRSFMAIIQRIGDSGQRPLCADCVEKLGR